MRWKKPRDGDIRVVKYYALFPIEINKEVAWLETCYILQRYSWCGWQNRSFVTQDDYEKYLKGCGNSA